MACHANLAKGATNFSSFSSRHWCSVKPKMGAARLLDATGDRTMNANPTPPLTAIQATGWTSPQSCSMAVGISAFERLLRLAESSDTGQARRVASFLATCYNSTAFPWDPFDLRAVDIAISDDMLTCLDALRWGQADLHTLVSDGDGRLQRLIKACGMRWPEDNA